MNAVYEWLANASAWWWPRFADHLWQSTLFALLVLAATFALRRGPARWRHTLCLVASLKFVLPIALLAFLARQGDFESLFPILQPSRENASLLAGITEPLATIATNYEVTVFASDSNRGQEFYLALTLVWLSGVLTILLFRVLRRQTFIRSLDLGEKVQSGREWIALQSAQKSLGVSCNVGLVISPAKVEPGVWRVWRPVIVLPASMATLLDDEELEAIMLHEMIHIQRRDNLVGQFQLAVCALLWFHPLVWFISRQLFDEREQACDERVMEICAAPQAYASSILKVVRFCFGWKIAGATGAAGGANLRRRIENIMANNMRRRASGHARLLATSLLGLALLFTVGAGFYSRPHAASAVVREPEIATSLNDDGEIATAGFLANQTSSTKTTKALPVTPPAPPDLASLPALPSAPTVSTPAVLPAAPVAPRVPTPAAPSLRPLPATPATPVTPAIPSSKVKEKAEKIKDAKEKAKEKDKDEIEKGELIEAPPPVYPEEAKQQKIEGRVVVEIVIGDDGKVISAKARSGPDALHLASEQAAAKARFRPTTVNGKPAKVSGALSYNFVLDQK